MPRRKNNTQVVEENTTVSYDMGEFQVIPYAEQQYNSTYLGIREMYFQICKKSDANLEKEAFDTKFEQCFGKVENKTNSLEELEQFAQTYFNKYPDQVSEYYRNSLNRRKKPVSNGTPKLKSNVEKIPY